MRADENGEYYEVKRIQEPIDRSGYKVKSTEKKYRTWDGEVSLTVFEKMAIESLNKPR